MLARSYEATATFESADEPGVKLELEIFDSRLGDTVRLRRVSFGGLLRRTLLAIQVESFKVGDGESEGVVKADAATLATARAVGEHLKARGWQFNQFTMNQAAPAVLAPIALFEAQISANDFHYVAEQLPAEYRARSSDFPACTA